MDQLIAQITQRTGISDEQARQAVEIAINFIKTKLPPALGSQLDSLLNSQGNAGTGSPLDSVTSQLPGGLGDMFGKK